MQFEKVKVALYQLNNYVSKHGDSALTTETIKLLLEISKQAEEQEENPILYELEDELYDLLSDSKEITKILKHLIEGKQC